MSRWTCPACDREFARAHQSHVCVPGCTVDEVRPKARSVSLALILPRPIAHARISRKIRISAERVAHLVKLTSVEDVDDQIRDWLSEAYDAAGG